MAGACLELENGKIELEVLCTEIVQQIKAGQQLRELDEYWLLIKKNVPFFTRNYFAAYLLRELTQSGSRNTGQRVLSKQIAPGSQLRSINSAKPLAAKLRHSLPEGDYTALFVGIGRNRKAQPKTITAFILENTGIEPACIGDIRILDNYSFAQINSEVAEQVIEKLNGKEWRAKPVVVSYARPKKDLPAGSDGDDVSS